MALERVPADIRVEGGVARMSDPAMIREIQEAVTIPVMAKCRIGHFVEAQILEALEVDYVDESEVLTPADVEHHVDKWAFDIPFVCGCTNLGEALRRIGEGAAMIRTKGEAGTGDIVNAVTHMRAVFGGIRRLRSLRDGGALCARRRSCARRTSSSTGSRRTVACRSSRSPRAASRRRRTRRSACSSARTACSSAPASSSRATQTTRAKAIVEATTHFDDAEVLADVSAGLGDPMVGISRRLAARRRSARNPRLVNVGGPEVPPQGVTIEELRLATRNHGMPLEALRYPLTPVGLHYVLVHYDIPFVDPAGWRLHVTGRRRRASSRSRSTTSGAVRASASR